MKKLLKIVCLILLVFLIAVKVSSQKKTGTSNLPYKIDASNPSKKIFSGHLKMGGSNPQGDSISFTNYYMLINNEPVIPVMGEFHYSRYPGRYWEEEILKMKAGGCNVIPTYVFWNIHEEEEGVFDWTGDKNLRRFVELCAKNDVWTIVRIGPFCHGEIRNGGLPDWLYGKPFQVRSNDEGFLNCVKHLYNEIGRQLQGLMFKDGGPVIGIQLENEYQHSASPWSTTYIGQPMEWTIPNHDMGFIMEGAGSQRQDYNFESYGDKYMRKLKEMAIDAGLIVPIYTVTGWGNAATIENETLPVTSAYPYPNWADLALSDLYQFKDIHENPDYSPVRYIAENYPSFCAEMGGGMIVRYTRRPVVPPLSLEALVVRSVGSGANGIGYYMFHGGSTPRGKHSYMNDDAYGYPKISYDFQAPVREFGQLNESYNILKTLHYFLADFGNILAPMITVLPEEAGNIKNEDTETLRWAVRTNGHSGFVFMTNFQDHSERIDQENLKLIIQLEDEILTIPSQTLFTLKKNHSVIFPFNVNLQGLKLKYATAQLVMRLDSGEETHYIFYAPEGILPEYVFDLSSVKTIEYRSEQINRKEMEIIEVNPGLESTLTVECEDGSKVLITTITREQELQAWKVNIGGKERLIISESVILGDKDLMKIISMGKNLIHFNVIPDFEEGLKTNSGNLIRNKGDNYGTYSLSLPKRVPKIIVERINNQRITFTLDDRAMTGLSDIFLKIDYTGDTGMAFIDGRLVNDNFYYGKPWWIGLKRYVPEILEKGMYFYFKPLYRDAPFLIDLDTDKLPDLSNGDFVIVKSITAIPEYQVIISPDSK